MDKKQAHVVVLTVLLVIAAFFIGSLTTKVKYLEQGGAGTPQAANPNVAGQQPIPTQKPANIEDIKKLFNDKNITFGDSNSKNLLVEVADPSCPFCHVAAGHNPEINKQMGSQFTLSSDGGSYVPPVPEMKKLVDEGKAAFVWIYTNGHGNGELATKALYCAHEKGDFWPVHDKLMTNDGYNLINNTIKNDKTKAGELAEFLANVTDQSALQSCLEGGKYDGKIAEDSATAASIGVNGTPGFYVNTANYAGAYSWNDMKGAVK